MGCNCFDFDRKAMSNMIIAPSILSANFAKLGEECEHVLASGADWIHIDVMDQHYVPNLTVGPLVVKALRNHLPNAFLDTHLMIEPVDPLVSTFAESGSSLISFHPEASRHVDRTIRLIQHAGVKVGLVLNPATPLSVLDYTLPMLDLVLLMSVNPGFGGQSFLPHTLEKIKAVRARIDAQINAGGQKVILQIDGGITKDNIGDCAKAGADAFVSGTAIFGNGDYANAIRHLRASI